MRFAVTVLALGVALAVRAEPPKPAVPTFNLAERMEMESQLRVIRRRALDLEPRRRDTPMRELNITDNEVREIQAVASRHLVRSMLNISPIVTGCACEEGPLCTDQVYVVATTATQTTGLQLSRIRNAWVMGPVQRWWLDYAALRERRSKMDLFEYLDAEGKMLLEFPFCAKEAGEVSTTAQSPSEKK